MQLDKEDIQRSFLNSKYLSVTLVFLISWFSYLFLLFSISFPVKYDFILRHEAWVNALTASSFIKNVPQIRAKPIAFEENLPSKPSRNRSCFADRFSAKWASKILAKFPRNRPFFPANFSLQIPRNLTVFFRDLPEACHADDVRIKALVAGHPIASTCF